jgi:hypothetical protein
VRLPAPAAFPADSDSHVAASRALREQTRGHRVLVPGKIRGNMGLAVSFALAAAGTAGPSWKRSDLSCAAWHSRAIESAVRPTMLDSLKEARPVMKAREIEVLMGAERNALVRGPVCRSDRRSRAGQGLE